MAATVIAGISIAILSVWMRQMRPEFALLLSLAGAVLIFYAILSQLDGIVQGINRMQSYITVESSFLKILLKLTGITYLAELACDICMDAGCQTIARQIEIFGKLLITAVSMPIILGLLDTVFELLSLS